MKTALTDRVQAGVEFLDKSYPGWREHIDTGSLDMISRYNCILAQASGEDIGTAMCQHDISWNEMRSKGFYLYFWEEATYDELTAHWVEAIQAR